MGLPFCYYTKRCSGNTGINGARRYKHKPINKKKNAYITSNNKQFLFFIRKTTSTKFNVNIVS